MTVLCRTYHVQFIHAVVSSCELANSVWLAVLGTGVSEASDLREVEASYRCTQFVDIMVVVEACR